MRALNIKYAIVGFLIFNLQFVIGNKVSAQQLPLYSSYIYNQMLLSPSFAGNFNDASQTARLMLAHRYQYAGFEGAPTTSLLALDAPFAKQNMGLGGTLFTDKMGLIRQTGFQMAYSYNVKIGEKATWHLGLAANAGQQSLDLAAARAIDINENILNLESANKVFVNGTFGTHITAGKLTAGFAIQQLTRNQLLYQNYTSNVAFSYEQPAHTVGFASYDFDLKGDTFGITPMLTIRHTAGTPIQYDVIVKAHIKHKLFLTAGYRGGYALSFGAGAVLSNNLTLSYTYDHMINDAGPFTGGGNEFTLGYRFFKGSRGPVTPNTPATVINQGLTQEEVDRMFEERVQTMRDKMTQLADENASQKEQLERLNKKIDSLHMTHSEMEVAAAEVEVKDGFVANNLQFDSGSAKLTPDSETELDKIAAYLILNEDVQLSISGHTDNTGNAEANLLLSKKRAAAVHSYLVSRGVDNQRMKHEGYGSARPIAENTTAAGRIKNRRVELEIK